MDPISLLMALVALTLFPGGLYVAAIAVICLRSDPAGTPAREWTVPELVGAALALVAASLAPLPGSPLDQLPKGSGISPNVAAAVLLMAAAVALGTSARWPARRMLTGLAALPLLALAASTSTLAFGTLAVVPGAAMSSARILAAAALLVAAPTLSAPIGRGSSACATVIAAAIAVLALGLVMPATLRGHPGWWVGLAVFAGAAAHGAIIRRLPMSRDAPGWSVSLATIALAGAATASAVVAGSS